MGGWSGRDRLVAACMAVALGLTAAPVRGAFPGTDVFLPSVGRGPGTAGSLWSTTVWVHNPGTEAADVQLLLLLRDQANPSPPVFAQTIEPGGTVRYENAVETLFGQVTFGAIRVVSPARVLVSARVFSTPVGGDLKDTVGQFFSGIPASFAIGNGQATELLGVHLTVPAADSQLRYNFGMVEVSGQPATVRVQALDETGEPVGSPLSYPLRPFEVRQRKVDEVLSDVGVTNARLHLQVVSGAGRVVAFGSGIANRSNDPSTFEMAFRPELLAEANPGGLTSVAHNQSLTGDGTATNPLGIAPGAVGSAELGSASVTGVKLADGAVTSLKVADGSIGSSKLVDGAVSAVKIASGAVGSAHLAGGAVGGSQLAEGAVSGRELANGAVTLGKLAAAGAASGKVLGTDGATLVWQAGGGGGLTLPFAGTGTSGASTDLFSVQNTGAGRAVHAVASADVAVWAESSSARAVDARSTSGNAVYAKSSGADAVVAETGGNARSAVSGTATTAGGFGVSGRNGVNRHFGTLGSALDGVYGEASGGEGAGVYGFGNEAEYGVQGLSSRSGGVGVAGRADSGIAAYGVWGVSNLGYAGYFSGKVQVTGNLNVAGTKQFKIDHPLDPEGRYLYHAAVESSEVLNAYSGNVVLDADGRAVVQLPEWFEALNVDVRYQLTCVGGFAPVHVAEEVRGNRFVIAGGRAGLKVSWQLTARRNDAYMQAHPFRVEEAKEGVERGTFLCPEALGQGGEKSVEGAHHPVARVLAAKP